VSSYRFSVVSPEEAAAAVYPYVHVNEDGSARELHASEREYLETPFMPNDSARPYVKSSYRSRSGWFGISGFCRRSDLPSGMAVAEAPAEDPSRRLTIDDIRDMLRARYEAPATRAAAAGPHDSASGGEQRPEATVRPPRPVAAPAPAGQPEESPSGRLPWTVGLGVVATVAVVLLRSAVHHPQLKDQRQRGAVRSDQGDPPAAERPFAIPGLSSEEVIRRMNVHRFDSIVACQRRLGISDEALDSLLRRAWRAQHPDGPAPWEALEPGRGDWRTSVTWNVEAVEEALVRMARGPAATPVVPEP